MTDCNFSLDAARPDGYFPNYQFGNVAILRLRTHPKQINQRVCRKRWFKKFGEKRYTYQGEVTLGTTDSNGIFVKYAYIPDDPNLHGYYHDKYYICDCPQRWDVLSYSVGSRELMKAELTELSDKVEESIEKVKSLV